MITQTIDLDLIPNGINSIKHVHVSQRDEISGGLIFRIWNGSTRFSIPTGATASIEGTKPDGHGFAYECQINDNTVVANLTYQMTCVYGLVRTEVRLKNSAGEDIGTCNFYLDVELAGLADTTDISDTDIPLLVKLATEQMNAAKASAEAAKESEENAEQYAQNAKESEDNAKDSELAAKESEENAKKSEEEAFDSAELSVSYADLSESWAHGNTGVREGEDTDNSKYWSLRSESSATDAKNYMEIVETYKDVIVPTFYLDFDTMILYQTNDVGTLGFSLDENNILYYEVLA